MGARKKKEALPLTDKEEAFVEHYIRDFNAAGAARAIGIPEAGARVQASRMLTNVNIQTAIDERLEELKMSTAEWYVRVGEQARGDLGEFLRDDGTIDLAKARAANKTRLLAEYQEETTIRPSQEGDPIVTTKKKIKLHSSQKALDMLGQRVAIPEAKQAQLEAQVALLENKLEELQKREVLLAFLEQNATPEVYQEVLRLLTGGPQAKRPEAGGKSLQLRWADERAPHDPGAGPVPAAEGDREPPGSL